MSFAIAAVVAPLCACHGQEAGPNLLANPDFEAVDAAGLPAAWAPVWARDTGTASVTVEATGAAEGTRCVKVTHTGGQDWSFAFPDRFPVRPMDIFRISARVRSQDLAGSAEIGVVVTDDRGEALHWIYGARRVPRSPEWSQIGGRLVAPPGASQIQFRLTGAGVGTVWIDDAELRLVGNLDDLRAQSGAADASLETDSVRVLLEARTGALTVTDRRAGIVWRQAASGAQAVCREVRASEGVLTMVLEDVVGDLLMRVTITASPPRGQ